MHGDERRLRRAINVADLSPVNDMFTTLAPDAINWRGFSGLPANEIERRVRGLKISRYRAALQAVAGLGKGEMVVTHLPLMTAATSVAMALFRKRNPHLAFSFNFTELPEGRRLAYLTRALRTVDQFAIYSSFERDLYAGHFDLDPSRFKPVIWTQDVPAVQSEPALPPGAPYVCAIGGEGRDFATLLEAARRVGPALRFVIVARPHSLEKLSIPDHVQVLTNIPSQRAWRIACDSLGVLIPLKSKETCCGQITLVSAKMLGLPIVTTGAYATREYVEGRAGILECDPGDPEAFSRLIQRLMDERVRLLEMARQAAPAERAFHDREQWADYLRGFVAEYYG